MIEARDFARRHPYHPHKLVAIFSAMRHFRDTLREAGREVSYRQASSFEDGLAAHLDTFPDDSLVVMRPSSHGTAKRLRELSGEHGGALEVVANDLFCCTNAMFDEWAESHEQFRHERFYRYLRRETGYLVEDGEPAGGRWNFDEQNRETPPPEYEPPAPPTFQPDELTRDVIEEIDAQYDGGEWADPRAFRWPITRERALSSLEDFVANRLPRFGPYEDAMVGDEWALNHSLLSVPLNLGLLHPSEVIERSIDAWRARDDIPINSVEGFVRQILGWREFIRHIYRVEMPALAATNRLDATRDLPQFYWDGETEMHCLQETVRGVRKRGYSHHIQRLMVLSNFGLLYGVDPHELNRWFQASHVDGHHWVATPNVVEMGQFAGDIFATKPYAASANYIDNMSDYCDDCVYDPNSTTGENACPFNALYWDFLDRHEGRLGSNPRMQLVYSHLDDKGDEELTAIRDRVADIRDEIETR